MYAHEIIVCMICTTCNNQIPGLEDTVAASFRIFVPRQGLESSLKFRGEGGFSNEFWRGLLAHHVSRVTL